MSDAGRPGRGEATEYYFRYIDLVPEGDICATLEAQLPDTTTFLERVPADRSGYAYEPGKWTIRDVLAHVNDTERLFVFRAFWFARGLDLPLPSFDPDIAARHAGAADRSWASLVEEFRSIRLSTVHFFRGLPAEAWLRRGIASDNPFSVRALAYLAAGHVTHHVAILRDRYLPGTSARS